MPPDPMPGPGIPETMKTWLRNLPALLGVVLLIGAIYVVQSEFRHLRLRDIGEALHAIPPRVRWHSRSAGPCCRISC